MGRARGLSKADLQLWAAFSQDITLLPGKTRLKVEPEPAPPIAPGLTAPSPRPPSSHVAMPGASGYPRLASSPPPGLDTSTWKKFATGKLPTTRTLDLHGMTATRAHYAVTHFLERAHADQLRVVEIITGKGEVLARELPHWLNGVLLRRLILAVAHPHAANTGSVRILLRRMR